MRATEKAKHGRRERPALRARKKHNAKVRSKACKRSSSSASQATQKRSLLNVKRVLPASPVVCCARTSGPKRPRLSECFHRTHLDAHLVQRRAERLRAAEEDANLGRRVLGRDRRKDAVPVRAAVVRRRPQLRDGVAVAADVVGKDVEHVVRLDRRREVRVNLDALREGE